jgi:lipopolysaccharide/colanic/teichoic acid biosynthesis glycosyltransferase
MLMGRMNVVRSFNDLAAGLAENAGENLRGLWTNPRIAGLWHVNGPSYLGIGQSVRLDRRSLGNWTLTGNIARILMTIEVLTPRGA